MRTRHFSARMCVRYLFLVLSVTVIVLMGPMGCDDLTEPTSSGKDCTATGLLVNNDVKCMQQMEDGNGCFLSEWDPARRECRGSACRSCVFQ